MRPTQDEVITYLRQRVLSQEALHKLYAAEDDGWELNSIEVFKDGDLFLTFKRDRPSMGFRTHNEN